MKYVFISKQGEILPLAQQVEAEGNQVDMYVCTNEDLIVDRHITDNAPDIIVFDSAGFGKLAYRLSRSGFSVLGSSMFTDQLEETSGYSEKVLRMCGLPTSGSEGIDLQIDAWFNGKIFTNHVYCLDNIVSPGTSSDKLFTQYISKLVPALKKSEYRGPVIIGCKGLKDTASFYNLRARIASPTMLVLKEGLKGRISNLLVTLAHGQNRAFMFKPGYFIAISINLNPGPLFDTQDYCEFEAFSLGQDTLKHMWLFGFTHKSGDKFIYRGYGGRIAVVTARGDTIREARRRAYRTIFNLTIPGILFLQKVGKSAMVGYSNLRQWGWIS